MESIYYSALSRVRELLRSNTPRTEIESSLSREYGLDPSETRKLIDVY